MIFATLAEIKKELQQADADWLQALCLRLAKYKKENDYSGKSDPLIPGMV
jgi:hypothetical protein